MAVVMLTKKFDDQDWQTRGREVNESTFPYDIGCVTKRFTSTICQTVYLFLQSKSNGT